MVKQLLDYMNLMKILVQYRYKVMLLPMNMVPATPTLLSKCAMMAALLVGALILRVSWQFGS